MKFIFYTALVCAVFYLTASWAINSPDDAAAFISNCTDVAKNIVASVDDYFHGVSNDNT